MNHSDQPLIGNTGSTLALTHDYKMMSVFTNKIQFDIYRTKLFFTDTIRTGISDLILLIRRLKKYSLNNTGVKAL